MEQWKERLAQFLAIGEVLPPQPWRVFLQHLKSCEDTRFFSAQTAGLSSVV